MRIAGKCWPHACPKHALVSKLPMSYLPEAQSQKNKRMRMCTMEVICNTVEGLAGPGRNILQFPEFDNKPVS